MFLISNVGAWALPAIALLIYLFWKRPKSEALLVLLMIGLCILFGDFLSSWVAKPFFSRFRPTHTPELQETLHYVYGYHGKLYGFFSGHSANYAAVATFLCLVLRRRFLATGYRDPREIFHEGTVYFVCALWISIPVTLMMALQVTRILRMVVE